VHHGCEVASADQQYEGKTDTITLTAVSADPDADNDGADEPKMMKLMVDYLYKLDYDVLSSMPVSTLPEMPAESRPATLNMKQRLHRAGIQAIARLGSKAMLVHTKVFALAVKYQMKSMKQLAAQKFEAAVPGGWDKPSFIDTIIVVYTSTSETERELCDVVVETLYEHKHVLEKEEVKAAICDTPILAYDLFEERLPERLGVLCPSCETAKLVRCMYCPRQCLSCDCRKSDSCGLCRSRELP